MSSSPAIEDLLGTLRAGGLRITTARRGVLEAVVEAGDEHLSAEDLAARIHRRHPDVHLSTVYRTVEALEDAGVLAEVHMGPGPSTYHLAADTHHHAVCDRCGAVMALDPALLAPVVERLDEDLGFAARPRHLTINGLCATCRSR